MEFSYRDNEKFGDTSVAATDQVKNWDAPETGIRPRPASKMAYYYVRAIERFSRERFRLVFVASLIIFVASSWLATRIRLESEVLNLIPHGDRQVDTFREALHEFGSIDY